ncbi:MAG: hypothetical protein JZU65_22590, partial [Chlorobium sp.]|nr:hypothetical protein [Chlorobium sp.]
MYSDPPLIKTTMSPTDIIGGNLQLLTDHCKTWWGKNEHNGKENVMAAKILGRLRDHGYSVTGTDAYGNLEFSLTLQSKVDQVFQPGMKELVGRSQKELSE